MTTKNNLSATVSKSGFSIHQMSAIALMTALMCILAPLSIPIGPVPISLTNFIIYLTVYLLGTKLGTVSYCLYLLLGMAGLPVFSGYSGGIAKLAGPTGGYLVGFIFMIIVSGAFFKIRPKKKIFSIIGMLLGAVIAYLFGTVWFMIEADCTLWYALTACVFPFLIGDAIKILLVSNIGPFIQNSLNKTHLLEKL